MKNKKIIVLIITMLIAIILVGGFMLYKNNSQQRGNIQENEENKTSNEIVQETNDNIEENINEGSENMNNKNETIKINLIVNNKNFGATLNNNETTRQLVQMFPITLNMSDLHSNEKYNYLDSSLTTNSSRPSRINSGDIKLYGNNCLVVFYKSFSNSYDYTDLGKVDDVDGFISELGSGSVDIRFEPIN